MSAPLKALPADALAMGTIHGKTVQIDPLTNAPTLFVYQRTSSRLANHTSATHPRLQLRREKGGKKGNTPWQEQHRAVFSEGVNAYKNLTPEARQQIAAERQNAGYRGNLYAYFMSRYMMNNPTT